MFLAVLPPVSWAQAVRADRLISLGDPSSGMKTDERIAAYQKMTASQPNNVRYQNLLAAAYIQKMRETTDFSYIERAAKIVENVLAADAGNYEALRLRGAIELERHNFARVAEYSRDMARFAPDDPWNWGTLGDALMELGEYDRAGEAYRKMMALRPDLSSYNRASYYRFVTGDAAGAIDLMKQAIASGSPAPENVAWCQVDLGNMYFKTGKLTEAEAAYTAALRLFPGYHTAHAGLGRVSAARGKLQAAIENYKRARESVPYPEYAAALRELYSLVGKKDDARKQSGMIDLIDQMERAANQKANRNLALIYADQDRKLDRALELAEAELEVRKDVYTYDALAWALYKNKRYAEADKASEKALKLGTPEPAFYYHAGMVAHALGKKPEAKQYLEKALSLNPKFDIRQAPVARQTLNGLGK
jgi:tetratricopeptide (TPR) repeat protein